jgi:membrane protein involved in colicin uptake
MEISRFRESGGPSARSMVESIVLHVVLLGLLMLVAATFLTRSGASRTQKELDIVFYHP